jgi:predicted RNA binding protein YcfA (HicA-like mRNA interferase family)
VSDWPSTPGGGKIGWEIKRQTGSHKTLARSGWSNFVFAFHNGEEIGPRMLARIAKKTGLRPEDL